MRRLAVAVASAGFIGFLPYKIVPFAKWKGGGLLGSVAGWGLFWLMPPSGVNVALGLLGMAALAIWSSHLAEKYLGAHDDPRIVIDEVAGVWVAAAFLPREMPAMLGALVFFRVFDVFKGPWGNWAARAPGGWGIVADDLLAGLIANGCVRAGIYFVQG